jgi:hypothetical protein
MGLKSRSHNNAGIAAAQQIIDFFEKGTFASKKIDAAFNHFPIFIISCSLKSFKSILWSLEINYK